MSSIFTPPESGSDIWVVRLSLGASAARVIELHAREERAITLGSASGADLRVQGVGVAPVHCSIQRRGLALLLLLEAPNRHLSVNGGPALASSELPDRCTIELGLASVHVTLFRSNLMNDVVGTGGTEILSREWLYPDLADPRRNRTTAEHDLQQFRAVTAEWAQTLRAADDQPWAAPGRWGAFGSRAPMIDMDTLPLGTRGDHLLGQRAVPRRARPSVSAVPPRPTPLQGFGAPATRKRPRLADRVVYADGGRGSRHRAGWGSRLSELARERPASTALLTLALAAVLILCFPGADRLFRPWP